MYLGLGLFLKMSREVLYQRFEKNEPSEDQLHPGSDECSFELVANGASSVMAEIEEARGALLGEADCKWNHLIAGVEGR